MAQSRRLVLYGGLLVLITTIAYLPAIRGGFVWDDDQYVTRNAMLTQPDGLARIWFDVGATPQYYPLVFTTFWLEHRLWGFAPLGYHVVNVLLHAANALMLFFLLRRLRVPGAALAAAVFALHPVHVESVAWITERKNVLSGLFYLCSLACYLRFAGLPDDQGNNRPQWNRYGLSLLLFCGALLSKSVTASLPAVILLILWWKRGRITGRDVWPLVPFFALGVAMGLTTAWVEQHHVGAERVQWGLSPIDRVLIAGRAIWFYLGKLLWPHPLMFTYPRWRIDSSEAWQFGYPAAAITGVIALWFMRKKAGKGPLIAALFFVGSLFPALGFVNVYPMIFSFVADHFQYLASIGPIALFAALLARLTNEKPPFARVAGAACLVLPLGILTWRQGPIYRNLETLWRDTLTKNDGSWMAHNNLGVALNIADRPAEAVPHFKKAIELYPSNPTAYNGLADSLLKLDRLDEGIVFLNRALQIDPDFAFTHYRLGEISERKGLNAEAVEQYQRALELNPELGDAHNALAILLEARGEVDSALPHYLEAIEAYALPGDEPKRALVHFNIGALQESRGRFDDAIESYRRAVELKPDYGDAYLNLANLLFRRRETAEAARFYEQAAIHLPANAQAQYNYGVTLSDLGRVKEAARQFASALRIKPDYAEARFGLARLLEVRGHVAEALREYETILRDHPEHAAALKRAADLRGGSGTTTAPASQPDVEGTNRTTSLRSPE